MGISIDIHPLVGLLVRGLGTAAILLIFYWFVMAWYEARTLMLDNRTIRDPRVPPSLSGIRLLFAADIHAGPIFGASRVRHLVDRVNAEAVDVILLGGDYVGGRAGGAAAFYPEIARLAATRGVLAVLGNHDVWEGIDEARAGFERAGVTLLENDAIRIEGDGGAIVIVGLEDEWTGAPETAKLESELNAGEFGVLVAHNPDSFQDAWTKPGTWGLALAGHTHGGQVVGVNWLLPHKATRIFRELLEGWGEHDGTPLLVSNGVGAVTLPLRFLAPPQIHVITLEHTQQ